MNINIIKQKRLSIGLTQEQISRILDISLRYYQLIEKGKSTPNVILALKLCKILNINPYSIWYNHL